MNRKNRFSPRRPRRSRNTKYLKQLNLRVLCDLRGLGKVQAGMSLLKSAAGELNVPWEKEVIQSGNLYDPGNSTHGFVAADLMRKTQITDMTRCDQIVETFSGVARPCRAIMGPNLPK